MKILNGINKILLMSFLGLSLVSTNVLGQTVAGEGGGSSVGGGGDIFDLSIKGKKGKVLVERFMTFDQIEYENPFMPRTDVAEYDTHISPRLKEIEAKLPETGKYLRGMFEGEGPMWYWVEPTLREVNDEEATALDLTTLRYQKIQLAILSVDDLVVQVNEKHFGRLPVAVEGKVPGRAFAIMHEGIRAAITRPVFNAWKTSIDLRKLTGMLLNPNLTAYSKSNIGRMILTTIKSSGPLALAVARDLGDTQLIEKLTYQVLNIEGTLAKTVEYQSTRKFFAAYREEFFTQTLPDGSVISILAFQGVQQEKYGHIYNLPTAVQAFRITEDRVNHVNIVEATPIREVLTTFGDADKRTQNRYFRMEFANKVNANRSVTVRLNFYGSWSKYEDNASFEGTRDFATFVAEDFKEVQKVEARVLK